MESGFRTRLRQLGSEGDVVPVPVVEVESSQANFRHRLRRLGLQSVRVKLVVDGVHVRHLDKQLRILRAADQMENQRAATDTRVRQTTRPSCEALCQYEAFTNPIRSLGETIIHARPTILSGLTSSS
jgi:hypothetical protein